MSKIKQILKKIFFPNISVVIFFTVASAFLHTLSFFKNRETNVIDFFAYFFSIYVIIVIILDIPKALKRYRLMLSLTQKSALILFTKEFRTKTALYISWLLNLLYAAYKLFVCVFYDSIWSATEAVYYLLLSVIRLSLVKFGKTTDDIKEWKIYKNTGYLLLITNIPIILIIIVSIRNYNVYYSSDVILYISGIYTLYRLISSAIQMISYRKNNRPILSSAKGINISASALSLFSFLTALIAYSDKDILLVKKYSYIIGYSVSAIIIIVALFMIIRGHIIVKRKTQKA